MVFCAIGHEQMIQSGQDDNGFSIEPGQRGAEPRPGLETPSRSQRKREALAVFDLAMQLVALPDVALRKLELPEDLHRLVVDSRRISAHIARKRQLQYLAKQLRRSGIDLGPIHAALDHTGQGAREDGARLHRLEAWREALIRDGDAALSALLEARPDLDRQSLRSLLRQAAEQRRTERAPSAARALFRALRDLDAVQPLPAPPRAATD